jgi:hypothetical protein
MQDAATDYGDAIAKGYSPTVAVRDLRQSGYAYAFDRD